MPLTVILPGTQAPETGTKARWLTTAVKVVLFTQRPKVAMRPDSALLVATTGVTRSVLK